MKEKKQIFELSPVAIKKGDSEKGIVYNRFGNNFETLYNASYRSHILVRGKDGYLRKVEYTEPLVEYDLDGTPSFLQVPTYRNELSYTEDFSTNWNKQNVNLNISEFLSPEGKANAYEITETTLGTSSKAVYQTSINTLADTEKYNFSFFVKKDDKLSKQTGVRIGFGAVYDYVYFDLNTEEVLVTTSNNVDGGKLEYFGNNWYRVSVYGANNTGASIVMTPFIYIVQPRDRGTAFFFTSLHLNENRLVVYAPMLVFEEGGATGGTSVYSSTSYTLPYIKNIDATLNANDGNILNLREGLNDFGDEFIFYFDGYLLNKDARDSSTYDYLTYFRKVGDGSKYLILRYNGNLNLFNVLLRDDNILKLNKNIFFVNYTGEIDKRHRIVFALSRKNNYVYLSINGEKTDLFGDLDNFLTSDLLGSESFDYDTLNLGGASENNLNINNAYIKLYNMSLFRYDSNLLTDLIKIK